MLSATASLFLLYMINNIKDLYTKKFEDCEEAISYLKDKGWTDEKFILRPNKPPELITEEEFDAVDYLVFEWDWDCNLTFIKDNK